MQKDKAAELLAKLTAHGSDPLLPRGGIPELTAADLAAALSGIDRTPYLLALARYAQDTGVQDELFYRVYDWAVGMATSMGYRTPDQDWGQERLRKLTRMALAEYIHPPRCPWCRGAGVDADQRTCGACKGSRRIELTDLERAKAMGVSGERYLRVYRRVYERIYRELGHWEADALRGLIEGLEEDCA